MNIYFKILLFYCLSIIFLGSINSSTFIVDAIQHDSLRLFDNENHSGIFSACMADDLFNFLLYVNRPLFALVECFTFNFVDDLNDILVIKFFILCLMSISVLLLTSIFARNGFRYSESFIISLILHTLPAFQYTIQYNWIPLILSVICVSTSYLFLDSLSKINIANKSINFINNSKRKNYFQVLVWLIKKHNKKIYLILLYSLPSFFLQFCLFTYPVYSFIFIGFLILKINFTNDFSIIFKFLTFFIINLIIAFIIQKYFDFHYGDNWSWVPDHYKLSFEFEILKNNIFLFFNQSFKNILNFWFLNSSLVWKLNLIIFSILFVYFFIISKNQIKIVLFSLLLLGFSFSFFALTSFFQQRLLIVSQINILFFILVMLKRNNLFISNINVRYIPLLSLSLFFIYVSFFSFNTLRNNNLSINAEMNFIKKNIEDFPGIPERIHFIKPADYEKNFHGYDTYADEFNIKNTNFPQNLKKIVNFLLNTDSNKIPIFWSDSYNNNIIPPKEVLLITSSNHLENFCLTQNMLLVDMNLLANKILRSEIDTSYYKNFINCNSFIVSSNSSQPDYVHFYTRALDKSAKPDDFWETDLNNDIELIFDFKTYISLNSFSFIFPENANESDIKDYMNRFPLHWKIEVSNDKEIWTQIFQNNKNANESIPIKTSEYLIEDKSFFKYLRFTFFKNKNRLLRIYELDLNYNFKVTPQ